MIKKYTDTLWDFRQADTKTYTHCFHSYPAMMIPQVAGRLIDLYGKDAKMLFDPYCGTGTSLVEANLRGIDAVGTDLNPLAILIARAKTTPIEPKILEKHISKFADYINTLTFGNTIKNVQVPNFKNIDYWFDKGVQNKLAIIKDFIDHIDDNDVKNFFKVAFSVTVRESSWTRKGEFKLYRIPEYKIPVFKPDVYRIMIETLYTNRLGLLSFMSNKKGNARTKLYDFNTVYEIPHNILKRESVDIIVTSPPYGDSRTTVAYGQFSRLANQWLGVENAEKLDNKLMGGIPKRDILCFESDILNNQIDLIDAVDKKRGDDVVSFYCDYQRSIDNVSNLIKKGGHACYVVGDRRVKGVTLETDEITREFFEYNGFRHIETIIRNIPNKRMPSKNSPTNEAGKLDTTMVHEYIVVMEKL